MINYTLLFTWPILIFGSIGVYKFGKKQWGKKGAWLGLVIFWAVFCFILMLIFQEAWWFLLISPIISG